EKEPGHHPRLLVRQEIPARARRRTAGLRQDFGGEDQATARDQVFRHPAAGAGGADRRRAADARAVQDLGWRIVSCGNGISVPRVSKAALMRFRYSRLTLSRSIAGITLS